MRPKNLLYRAAMILAGVALWGFTAEAQPREFLATHNGSLVKIETQVPRVRITYEDPRQSLAAIGVRPGHLLVEGRWQSETRFVGVAYVFVNHCDQWDDRPYFARGFGAFKYMVTGAIDGLGNLVLTGAAPVVRVPECRTAGYVLDSPNSVLVFEPMPQPTARR